MPYDCETCAGQEAPQRRPPHQIQEETVIVTEKDHNSKQTSVHIYTKKRDLTAIWEQVNLIFQWLQCDQTHMTPAVSLASRDSKNGTDRDLAIKRQGDACREKGKSETQMTNSSAKTSHVCVCERAGSCFDWWQLTFSRETNNPWVSSIATKPSNETDLNSEEGDKSW